MERPTPHRFAVALLARAYCGGCDALRVGSARISAEDKAALGSFLASEARAPRSAYEPRGPAALAGALRAAGAGAVGADALASAVARELRAASESPDGLLCLAAEIKALLAEQGEARLAEQDMDDGEGVRRGRGYRSWGEQQGARARAHASMPSTRASHKRTKAFLHALQPNTRTAHAIADTRARTLCRRRYSAWTGSLCLVSCCVASRCLSRR